MAHNLSDLFDQQIGRNITKLDENLYGLEIDPEYEMETNFIHQMKAFRQMMNTRENNEVADSLAMMPGIEELFSLLRIKQIYETGEYDVIIVDCASTGETLSLLKFPELFAWYMEKLFPIGKLAVRLLSPVSHKLFKIDLPNNKAINDIQKLYIQLFELQQLLKNQELSSIRLVTIPEKMVVKETKRNYMYLNLYNYNVDAVFINRVLPKDQELSFFNEWFKIQEKYIKELEMVFYDIAKFKVKWYDSEITGREALERIVEDVLKDDNILMVMKKKSNELYEKNSKGYILKLFIPNADKKEITLHENGEDIIIRIANFKRTIPLPNALRNYQVAEAKLEEDYLNIQFVKEERDNENE